MAHKKITGVQQYATGTGTGALTLGAATSSLYRTMQAAGMADGDTMYAHIQHATIPSEWEIVLVTYAASGTTITPSFDSRSKSPTGALISFSAGNKIVSEARHDGVDWIVDYSDLTVVSLDQFSGDTNPLQSALDFLGATGGTIRIPNRTFIIPGLVTGGVDYATSNLTSLALIGEGARSALLFPNTGGGIVLYFRTPNPGDMNNDQLLVERLSIITTNATAYGTALNGSGTGLAVSFALAVGDVTAGVTLRNVQIGCQNHDDIGGGTYQWWDVGCQIYNARQLTVDNCYFWGPLSPTLRGTGLDLNGGTVQVQLISLNVSDMDTGLYINGVCEGIQWDKGVAINVNYGCIIDGDVVGRTRSTSSTSTAIGTGSKTFTVGHTIGGPDGLSWTTLADAQSITIRDVAAPTTNYMVGTISSVTSTTVTVNVTAAFGTGTLSAWTLSPEHKIPQVAIQKIHNSARIRNFYLRWCAYLQISDSQIQHREEGTTTFWAVEIAQESDGVIFHDLTIGGEADTATTRNGILVKGTYTPNYTSATNDARVYNIYAHDIEFTSTRAVGLRIEANVQHVNVHDLRATGAITTLVDNLSTVVGADVKIYDCLNDDGTGGTNTWIDFGANDATPSIAMNGLNKWRTANSSPTTITAFDSGCATGEFSILVNDAYTTFAHNSNISMKGGVNFAAPNGTVINFVTENDSGLARELSRTSPILDATMPTASGTSDLLQTWHWATDPSDWGLRLYQRHTGSAIYYDLKTRNGTASDITAFTFKADGSFGSAGGLGNGFEFEGSTGWTYMTTNMEGQDPNHSNGLAVGWNRISEGEVDYLNGWTDGEHSFWTWDGADWALGVARADSFRTPNASIGGDSNGNIDLGGVNKTPYIDFNSYNGTQNDYDVRILVSGGAAATNGAGTLDIYAGTINFTASFVTLTGALVGTEVSAPSAPGANGYVIYAEDNGAGKTRLMVRFASGAAQQIAIEP